jgi:tripartite-type tricarboxylate transporter receptor subunit TctC
MRITRAPCINRRALLAGALVAPSVAHAQAWPTRAVTIVVPYAPGGGADALTRAIAPLLERGLGQPVIVENRAGAGGAVGSTYVAQSRADGYTLLTGPTPLAINPALQPQLTPREPMRELAPIGPMYRNPFVLHVHPGLPANTLAEFVAYARANPGAINYGSAGVGTLNHLAGELLAYRAQVRLVHVPYRGTGPALLDLRAGRTQAMFTSLLEGGPLLQERATRPLAVTSTTRLPQLPEVPPIADTLPGYDVTFWAGLFAPAGTPEPVLAKLAEALAAATADDGLRTRFAEQGTEILGGGPAALAKLLADDTAVWARVARETNLRLE